MTTTPFDAPVLVEPLQAMGDTLRHEAGVRRGYKRTRTFTAVTMPVYDRFESTLTQTLPTAWALDASMLPIIDRLRAHGIIATQLRSAWTGNGEQFTVDSLIKSPRPFQGHAEVRLEGQWNAESLSLPAGTWIISAKQATALVALMMLEPQSDDGLTTWNAFDDALAVGKLHPVRRILAPLPSSR
jgi:hypothetical protein